MEIKLTDQQLRDLVAESLFEKISPEERKEMITKALTALMQPPEYRGYGPKHRSKLDDAVEAALLKVAQSVIDEYFSRPEIVGQVQACVAQAFQRAVIDGRENFVNRLSQAIVAGLYKTGE